MPNFFQEMIDRALCVPPQPITGADVERWSDGSERHDFYDKVSLEIAQCFHYGSLSYEICDAIMNDLWWHAMYDGEGFMVSHQFARIFEAFDAGEYFRTRLKADDPVKEFTKPMIAAILAKHSEY